ncbi:MAG TPA: hypothetical protein VGC55_13815, partial [Dokdonella sp.]
MKDSQATSPARSDADAPSCEQRRQALKIAVIGMAGLGLLRHVEPTFADEAADKRPQPGDRLVDINGDLGKPLRIDDIKLASKPILAFPFD